MPASLPLARKLGAVASSGIAASNLFTLLSLIAHVSEAITPDAATDTYVDATGINADDAGNDFAGGFTDPDVPRNLTVAFAASWDGGDVTVTGTDQFGDAVSEVFTASAGSTVTGSKIFATVTAAEKGAVGAAAVAATIGVGEKLGLGNRMLQPVGSLAAGSIGSATDEAATWDGTYHAVTPTTASDASTIFYVGYNANVGDYAS